MIIKSLGSIFGFTTGDSSFLKELLHPDKETLDIGYSLAHAVVRPGEKTRPGGPGKKRSSRTGPEQEISPEIP